MNKLFWKKTKPNHWQYLYPHKRGPQFDIVFGAVDKNGKDYIAMYVDTGKSGHLTWFKVPYKTLAAAKAKVELVANETYKQSERNR